MKSNLGQNFVGPTYSSAPTKFSGGDENLGRRIFWADENLGRQSLDRKGICLFIYFPDKNKQYIYLFVFVKKYSVWAEILDWTSTQIAPAHSRPTPGRSAVVKRAVVQWLSASNIFRQLC